jgi:hypothetical protein
MGIYSINPMYSVERFMVIYFINLITIAIFKL